MTTTTEISQTLTRIFDEVPPDRFEFRRLNFVQKKTTKLKNDNDDDYISDNDSNACSHNDIDKNQSSKVPPPIAMTTRKDYDFTAFKNPPKRIKTTTMTTMTTTLLAGDGGGQEPVDDAYNHHHYYDHPEIVRLVSEFLDPLELHTWSCSSKAIRNTCTLAMKLDHVFSYFSILKRYTDWIDYADASGGGGRHASGGDHNKNYEEVFCSGDFRHSGDGDGGGAGAPDNRDYWNLILKMFLRAIQELYKVYGPYKVHPLHAAIVGEVLCIHLARRGKENLNEETSFNDVWNHMQNEENLVTGSLNEHFVLGNINDYFYDDEGIEAFQKIVENGHPHHIEKFPSGPARNLVKEGRIPYINIFCREEESHTDQFGFFFPNEYQADTARSPTNEMDAEDHDNDNDEDDDDDNNKVDEFQQKNNNNDDYNNYYKQEEDSNNIDNNIPAEIFVMNYQELLPWDTSDDACISWYKRLCRYNIENDEDNENDDNDDLDHNHHHINNNQNQAAVASPPPPMSLARVFCKHIPLYSGDEWDEWTQLLRAGWLKAHKIFPFDDSDEGKLRWNRVLESIGAGPSTLLEKHNNNNDSNETNPSNNNKNNNKDVIEHVTGETEVLEFLRYVDKESMQFSKSYAMVYLGLNHVFARGSDYVV